MNSKSLVNCFCLKPSYFDKLEEKKTNFFFGPPENFTKLPLVIVHCKPSI